MDMTKTTESLGDRLTWARKQRGLLQADVYKPVGITQSAYSEIENGQTRRSVYTAEFAKILEVDAYWLATGNGEPYVAPKFRRYERLKPERRRLVDDLIDQLSPDREEGDQ